MQRQCPRQHNCFRRTYLTTLASSFEAFARCPLFTAGRGPVPKPPLIASYLTAQVRSTIKTNDTRLLQRLGPSICPYESLVLRAVLRRIRVVIAHAQLGVPPASVRSLRTHNAMSACTCSHRQLRALGSERFSYGPGVRKERS